MARSPTQNEVDIFFKYDKNKSGAIEVAELADAMADLGLLSGRTAVDANACVVATFASADLDGDSKLSAREFAAWYRRATAPRLAEILENECPDEIEALKTLFGKWAAFGTRGKIALQVGMGTASWMKLCRDTRLVGPVSKGCLSSADADLVFAKVRSKGQQRLTFEQFGDALCLVAARMGRDAVSVVRQVTASAGPAINGTVVKADRFLSAATDEALFKYGRRASAPPLAAILPPPSRPKTAFDRKFAPPARTTAASGGSGNESLLFGGAAMKEAGAAVAAALDGLNGFAGKGDGGASSGGIPAHRGCVNAADEGGDFNECGAAGADVMNMASPLPPPHQAGQQGNAEAVLQVFGAFAEWGTGHRRGLNEEEASGGGGGGGGGHMEAGGVRGSAAHHHLVSSPIRMEMDSKQFLKLCRDCGLVASPAATTAADLCFAKAKARGARRITYADFLVALAMMAQEKGMTEAEVLAQVAACPGPRRNSTTPTRPPRLHSDRVTRMEVVA